MIKSHLPFILAAYSVSSAALCALALYLLLQNRCLRRRLRDLTLKRNIAEALINSDENNRSAQPDQNLRILRQGDKYNN